MKTYRFMMIGAHPDDLELRCSGLAMHLRQKGHPVMFLSMTDGSAGHQSMTASDLALRRAGEVRAVGKLLDIPYEILPIADAQLEPSLQNRALLMEKIRTFAPHVILTHRTVDYHPDHRACAQLVMDCAYLVNVPLVCPEVPCPPYPPVILSLQDKFTLPVPFRPDLVVPIDDVTERKIDCCLCHISQFYEWLPHINRWDWLPEDAAFEEKTRLLRDYLRGRFADDAAIASHLLPEGTRRAECFEWNEYGAPLTEELRELICGECS